MADTIRAGASGTVPPDTGARRTDPAASAAPASDAVRGSRITTGDLLRALLDDKVVLVAACFILLVVGSATFAGIVAPFDPNAQSIRTRMKPPGTPSSTGSGIPHLLGTDQLGRDVLTRLIYGA